jgi:hypothetical protein
MIPSKNERIKRDINTILDIHGSNEILYFKRSHIQLTKYIPITKETNVPTTKSMNLNIL